MHWLHQYRSFRVAISNSVSPWVLGLFESSLGQWTDFKRHRDSFFEPSRSIQMLYVLFLQAQLVI